MTATLRSDYVPNSEELANAVPRSFPDNNSATGPAEPSSGRTPVEEVPGRDSRGRFTAGNKGGPGNPFARKSAALRQAMLDAVTAEDLQAIMRQLSQKAQQGDVPAARLVLSYTVGKPDKPVDPDTLDLHEWHQLQQNAVPNDDLLALLGALQAPVACSLLRAALPALQEQAVQSLAQSLQPPLAVAEPAHLPTSPQQDEAPPHWSNPPTREKLLRSSPTQPQTQPMSSANPKRQRAVRSSAQPPPAEQSRQAHPRGGSVTDWLATNEELPNIGLEPEQEQHWLALLRQFADCSDATQRPLMSSAAGPPIPNGEMESCVRPSS